MIKKLFERLLGISLGVMLLLGNTAFAADLDFGAKGASEKENFTNQEMLDYAIQDE